MQSRSILSLISDDDLRLPTGAPSEFPEIIFLRVPIREAISKRAKRIESSPDESIDPGSGDGVRMYRGRLAGTDRSSDFAAGNSCADQRRRRPAHSREIRSHGNLLPRLRTNDVRAGRRHRHFCAGHDRAEAHARRPGGGARNHGGKLSSHHCQRQHRAAGPCFHAQSSGGQPRRPDEQPLRLPPGDGARGGSFRRCGELRSPQFPCAGAGGGRRCRV